MNFMNWHVWQEEVILLNQMLQQPVFCLWALPSLPLNFLFLINLSFHHKLLIHSPEGQCLLFLAWPKRKLEEYGEGSTIAPSVISEKLYCGSIDSLLLLVFSWTSLSSFYSSTSGPSLNPSFVVVFSEHFDNGCSIQPHLFSIFLRFLDVSEYISHLCHLFPSYVGSKRL